MYGYVSHWEQVVFWNTNTEFNPQSERWRMDIHSCISWYLYFAYGGHCGEYACRLDPIHPKLSYLIIFPKYSLLGLKISWTLDWIRDWHWVLYCMLGYTGFDRTPGTAHWTTSGLTLSTAGRWTILDFQWTLGSAERLTTLNQILNWMRNRIVTGTAGRTILEWTLTLSTF